MDPLSEVLSVLKPRSHLSGRFDIGQAQAIRFPAYEGVKCYAVINGQCWLSVEGIPGAAHVKKEHCFLLPSGRAFTLSTELACEPVPLEELLAALQSGRTGLHDGESGCFLAGGHFLLEGGPANLLLGLLPPIVHLRSDAEKASMRWSLDRMREELRNPQLGGTLVVQQLAYMMLVQALRVHLTESPQDGVGWLYALSDPRMKAAIVCMHSAPGKPWTVNGLAECAGMSRSIFAEKFKQSVGESPMEYLTRWRMLLATDRLTSSGDSIASIASSLGYDSESAFGKAFRRVMGCSPRRYSASGASFPPTQRQVGAASNQLA